ncbi:MAG: hypothetical protein ACYSTS_11875 [Planctomycetota bacterium]|jgi:hypothetical protein
MDKKEDKKIQLTKTELGNIINLISSHPTPQGVGSQEGQVKIQLVNKLSKMLDEKK